MPSRKDDRQNHILSTTGSDFTFAVALKKIVRTTCQITAREAGGWEEQDGGRGAGERVAEGRIGGGREGGKGAVSRLDNTHLVVSVSTPPRAAYNFL